MLKPNKITIAAIVLTVLVISSTLFYKKSLLENSEKSYSYKSMSNEVGIYIGEIKKRIKDMDKSFNDYDYLITYNEDSSNPSSPVITLSYMIDNTIATNKSYIVLIENETIKDIYKSTNEEVDEKELIKRVDNFNENDKESLLLEHHSNLFKENKILNKDKTINQNRFISTITKYEEKYVYDYNTKELAYILNIYQDEIEEIKLIIS